MHKRRLIILLLCILANFSLGYGYQRPEAISEKDWKSIQPYLLPEDSPAKPILDKIFGKTRVTTNISSFRDAGFIFEERQGRKRLIAKHPKLKGYFVKTYLDMHDLREKDWNIWKHRIDGAKQIQTCIDTHGYNHIMKVPKKWLYPLPEKPAGKGPSIKTCVLVAEDMHILDNKKNKKKYKTAIDKERLDALYVVLKKNKLFDSIHIFNIPFSKDGKIAFIDTEHFNVTHRPVVYKRMTKRFPSDLQDYWLKITRRRLAG